MFNKMLNLNEREFSARPLREIAYYARFSWQQRSETILLSAGEKNLDIGLQPTKAPVWVLTRFKAFNQVFKTFCNIAVQTHLIFLLLCAPAPHNLMELLTNT